MPAMKGAVKARHLIGQVAGMTDEAPFDWTCEHEELYHTRWRLGGGDVLHVQVESLWEHGWDWHVWDSSGRLDPRYGLADSLEAAKARAEMALDGMLAALGLSRLVHQSSLN